MPQPAASPSPAGGGGQGGGSAGDAPAGAEAAHTHGVATFAIILDGPVSRFDFARALGGLAQDRGNDLLRVKGLVRFADRPDRPAVVQAAQHAMFTPEWLDRLARCRTSAAASSLSSTTSRPTKSSRVSPSPRRRLIGSQPRSHATTHIRGDFACSTP